MSNARWILATLCGAALAVVALPSCGGGNCNDGIDNDGDGFIDGADPACANGQDNESPDPHFPQCSDGVDNDGDGKIDLDDTGCTDANDNDEFNEPVPQCKDGIDNDMDGNIDFPADPGCDISLDDDESDACPAGPGCPACGDGMDNDGDGKIDYPADPGCDAASDNDEFNSVSTECGTDPVGALGPDGSATGMIAAGGTNAVISATCGGSGSEKIYLMTVAQPVALEIKTDFPETTVDTVVYIRSTCTAPATELGCNDDTASNTSSDLVLPSVQPGMYYVVVDAQNNGSEGVFKLQVSQYLAQGTVCDPAASMCAPGLVCRLATPDATMTTCELPQCSDGVNNDGDTKIDFPNDPGCTSPNDNDETDDCPSGPMCPQCSDGRDNDMDGQTDYPADTGCTSAAADSEIDCADMAALLTLTNGTTTGTTTGTGNDHVPSCSSGSTAPEKVHRLVVPGNLTNLHVDTNGSAFDTVLYVKGTTCTTADIGCDDDGGTGSQSLLDLPTLPAGTYFIFVDGFSTNAGAYTLHVNGTIASGQPCVPATITSGLFTCAAGTTCTAGTCQ